ncbi:MAG: integration host factor subunit beta [Chitinophagales bacterium]|jgi:DNA-binding protein HU-beta|nr:integration host factor subunit beta [Chitinophagales bacterium]
MKKIDLVNKISKNTGIPKVDVMLSIEHFIKEVKKSLEGGENVYLRGFGSFIIKERKAKKARLIKENKEIMLPARKIPAFKPSKEFTTKIK